MNTVPTSDGLPDTIPVASSRRLRNTPRAAPRRRGLFARLPLKIADAYLLRHMFEATMRGLVWFVALLMMVTVIGAVKRLVDNTLDFGGMLRLLFSELPRVFYFTIPMAILFGTVQTFSDLSSKGEATALQVGGMSLGRMMRAPLICGAILGLFVFFLQEKWVPSTQQNKQKVLSAVVASSGVREDFQYSDPPPGQGPTELIVDAKTFDPANGRMEKPTLKQFGADGSIRSVEADRGVWNIQTGEWTLYNVRTSQVTKPGEGATGIGSKSGETSFKLPSPQALSNKTKSMRQHLDNGDFEVASISDLVTRRAEVKGELPANANSERRKNNAELINRMTYGIHDKIATPWVCVFLVLIGAPLALRPQRSSGGFSMGLSLVVLLIYYVLWSAAQGIGRGGIVNPIFTAYLPAASTLVVGLALFWKKSR